ncbi:MAG: hypothetical protein AAB971_00740 [Patescibacteria group bacterium]
MTEHKAEKQAQPKTVAPEYSLADDYAHTIEALKLLGLTYSSLAKVTPSLEEITDTISTETASWLNDRQSKADENSPKALDEFIIWPSTQIAGLFGTGKSPGLVARFSKVSKKTRHNKNNRAQSTMWEPAWGDIGDKDPLHDDQSNAVMSAGFLLGDRFDPYDATQPANQHNEAGLLHTGLEHGEQAELLDYEIAYEAKQGRKLVPAIIGQIVVANAKRLIAGEPLLDSEATVTRLLHYGPRSVVLGKSATPTVQILDVTSFEDQLRLGASNLSRHDIAIRRNLKADGVRRTLVLPLELPTESTQQ